MNEEKRILFQGQEYLDDRLFVLHLCKGTVETKPDDDGVIWTTIYHEQCPDDYVWCVVTYRNFLGYPISRVDSFYNREDAVLYIEKIEPETPLISLNGKSPLHPISREEYLAWKKANNFKEFSFKAVHNPGGTNAREIIGQTKEQFKGIE